MKRVSTGSLADRMSLFQRGNIEVLRVENDNAVALISLFGGQVLSFIPSSDGRERLWCSSKSDFGGKRAIRGGVPVCWPWFAKLHGQADDTLPQHGFLRTQPWKIVSTYSDRGGSCVKLKPTQLHGPGFSHQCDVVLTVKIGRALSLRLETVNTGNDAIFVGGALHTYIAVDSIHDVIINGLGGQYIDSADKKQGKPTPNPYQIGAETDHIHHTTASKITVAMPHAQTAICCDGHDSIVVWNPWQLLSASMPDMSANGYLEMLCIEAAHTSLQEILPGQSAELIQTIE